MSTTASPRANSDAMPCDCAQMCSAIIITGGRTQGGSTLTQQYVKNVYVGNDRTALRKVKEAALAVRLEHRVLRLLDLQEQRVVVRDRAAGGRP